MRRWRAVWLGAGVCACLWLPACAPRDRVNARCEWTGDSAEALDLSRTGDWRHLVADAQLAEDLAIRYDDAEEARGNRDNVGARCLATLVATIGTRHGVTGADVHRARAHRDAEFDRAVLGSFVALFAVVVWLGCRIAWRRYVPDPPVVRIAAAALAALAASALAVPLSSLWIVTWEMVRVGNDHLSAARAAKPPTEPLEAIVMAGVLAFSLTTVRAWHGAGRRHT